MELKGTHKVTVAPQVVWDALHNPTILKNCIPGIEEIAWQGEHAINARISGIGPMKGPYGGTVTVLEHTAPSHLKIGLSRTSVSGNLSVDLAPDGAGTLLSYTAQGTLAMLDNPLTRPLIDGQIGQFFSKLDAQIS